MFALGMQVAVIEFARNVLGYCDAHSTEMVVLPNIRLLTLWKAKKGLLKKVELCDWVHMHVI